MRWWPKRRLTPLQKFALLSLVCVLGITITVCGAGAATLRRYLLEHDAAAVGNLVSTLLTRSLPASFFRHVRDEDRERYARMS